MIDTEVKKSGVWRGWRNRGRMIQKLVWVCWPSLRLAAQPIEAAEPGLPGDVPIQRYLRQETERIEANFPGAEKTAEDWARARPRYLREYYEMLGLWPMPERAALRGTVTRTLERDGYVVEMVHYQSRPGLYVTANLYRPKELARDQRVPGILYVCGHAGRGRNGNKTAYQSHGIWFARHGYVCLMVDTLQLGEVAGIHHGTYREGRWWWVSRGYTPAGVECWNGIRGIDYLVSRPEVDGERIGVTGISGGGAATIWISAADERVKAAAPVSGMADLEAYVPERVVDGHCDCMFLNNTYQWPWVRIAGLMAPRPLLFVNSDQDPLFPMSGNERVINRLERIYSLFGAGDVVDSVVSIGEHAYRRDIRQGVYRFFNTQFKSDPRPVLDSEVDLVSGGGEPVHPILPEELRVFPADTDLPSDALNQRIDLEFVPRARVEAPGAGGFAGWQRQLLSQLREQTFHHFPVRIPPARGRETNAAGVVTLETESAISIRLRPERVPAGPVGRVWLVATGGGVEAGCPGWFEPFAAAGDAVYLCEERGLGGGAWTRKNPPNTVERSHVLLGRTVDSGRVWDLAAAARYVAGLREGACPVYVAGEGAAGVRAVYAGLLESEIAGLVLVRPPGTHETNAAPALLNVLRVCDVPEAIGMLAPRPVTLVGEGLEWSGKTAAIYAAAGAAGQLSVGGKR
jgi:dienelactone hydrolase